MTTTRKPRLFIASSGESLETAYAIQENLEHSTEVTVWTQGVFNLTRSSLTSLLESISSFDFAVFVFASDDITKMRDKKVATTRDNVIFELGLSMGELGEDRTFIVLPRNAELHLPTDLIGITPATYSPDRSDGNLVAALGPACTKINRAMTAAGIRASSNTSTLPAPVTTGLSEELRMELKNLLEEQERNIEKAFERFDKRLTDMRSVQDKTSKAPHTRLSNYIDSLSPTARALAYRIQKRHISREEYQQLLNSKIKLAIGELREKNLLVPLSGVDDSGEKIPVFWFPTGLSKYILAIVKENSKLNSSADKVVVAELKKAGYAYLN